MIKYIKWLKIFIGIIIVLHSVIFIALIFQNQIIFRSKSVPDSYKLKILIPHQEYLWQEQDSTKEFRQIHNLIYTPRKKNAGYIFFLHGPIQNAEYHTQYVSYFTDLGYTVWMMDYMGFGKSKGDLTENGLYEDAYMMFDTFAHQININPKDIIIIGKELGSGIAAKTAAEKNVQKLILISPYSDLVRLLKDYIPWFPFNLFINYKLPTDTFLTKFEGEIGIFAGSNDMHILLRNSRRLQPLLKPGDEFHEYSKKSYPNVMYDPSFKEDLELFLKK